MRLALLVVASLGSTAAADSFTVHVVPEKAGAKWTEEKLESSQLKIDHNGTMIPVLREHREKKTFQVVKVAGGVVTEAKLAYLDYSDVQQVGAKPKQGALAGKTYTLVAGTPLAVTGAATDDELALVRKGNKRFGQADEMDKVLDGRTFPLDKPIAIPPKAVAASLGDPDITDAAMSLTYRGLDGLNARFDITLMLQSAKSKVDVRGVLAMEAQTGRIVALAVKGSIAITGGQGTIEISERTTR